MSVIHFQSGKAAQHGVREWHAKSGVRLNFTLGSQNLMSNWYLKLTGQLAAAIGKLDKYSEEHQSFLSSGYECPGCKETLMNW